MNLQDKECFRNWYNIEGSEIGGWLILQHRKQIVIYFNVCVFFFRLPILFEICMDKNTFHSLSKSI